MVLQTICNWIVLISATLGAIVAIFKLFGKPITFFKKQEQKRFEERFKMEFDKYAEEWVNKSTHMLSKYINQAVDASLAPRLAQLEALDAAQLAKIDILIQSSKDMLREDILDIYRRGKETKTITRHDFERLKDLYHDYEQENGNGYIKKIKERMDQWEIIEED